MVLCMVTRNQYRCRLVVDGGMYLDCSLVNSFSRGGIYSRGMLAIEHGVRLVSGRTSVRYRFGSPFSSKRLWFVDTVL